MKKAFWISYLAAAVLGTAWHFLYTLLPCPLTALLAPVNESVWEHLKLLYFPPLAVGIVLSLRWPQARQRLWRGMAGALLAMPALLLGLYYGLTAGFRVNASLTFDIGLYYLVLAAGWYSLYSMSRAERADAWFGPLVIAAGVLGAALVVFTFAPPPLPIFLPVIQ